MNIARVLQNRSIITPAEFEARPNWCQLFVETVGDDLDENGEGWGEGLFVKHSSDDEPIDVSIQGLESWSGAPGVSDGCAAGIRGGAGAWVGGDRGTQHADYVSMVAITFEGSLNQLSSTQIIGMKENVKQEVIDQSEGQIDRSSIDYVDLKDGSIIAEVHFKPGQVSEAAMAETNNNLQTSINQGWTFSSGGQTFAATGSEAGPTVKTGSSSDDSDDTGMIIGIAVAVSVVVIILAVGGAYFYVKSNSNSSVGTRRSSTKATDEVPMTSQSPQYEEVADVQAQPPTTNKAMDF